MGGLYLGRRMQNNEKTIFCCFVFTFSINAQQYINGFDELEFGTTIEDFQGKYSNFSEGSGGKDLTDIGVIIFMRLLDFERGQRIIIRFFEGKFYRADIQYGYTSNNGIEKILKEYIYKYGKIHSVNESRYYSSYNWDLNEHFSIKASTSASNNGLVFDIVHVDPMIEKVIEQLLEGENDKFVYWYKWTRELETYLESS